jgi:hypothetical protein
LSQRSYDLYLDRCHQPRWLRSGEPRPGDVSYAHVLPTVRKQRITPLAAAPIAVPPWATEQGGQPGQPLFPIRPGTRLSRAVIEYWLRARRYGRPCTLLRLPRNPLIMPAFPALTRLPPAASPAWAATMSFPTW